MSATSWQRSSSCTWWNFVPFGVEMSVKFIEADIGAEFFWVHHPVRG